MTRHDTSSAPARTAVHTRRRRSAPRGAACFGVATLLGAAALAPAGAQTTVSLYGVLDAAAYSKQLAGEQRLATLTSGGMSTSNWGFRGDEDLGGGLRALFDISGFIQLDTGNPGRSAADVAGYWGRFAFVGLSSQSLGLIRIGRITVPGFVNNISFNAFGDSSNFNPYFLHTFVAPGAQPMLTPNGTLDSAWNNSIRYSTPSFGGLIADVQVAAGEGSTGGRRGSVGLVYRGGPFAIGFNADKLERAALAVGAPAAPLATAARPLYTATDGNTTQGVVSYDFTVVKLFLQANRTRFSNATANRIELQTVSASAAVPVGASGRVLVAWASTDQDRTGVSELTRDTVTLGYDYNFSKRTDVYIAGIHDKVTNLRSGTGYAAGLRHRF